MAVWLVMQVFVRVCVGSVGSILSPPVPHNETMDVSTPPKGEREGSTIITRVTECVYWMESGTHTL